MPRVPTLPTLRNSAIASNRFPLQTSQDAASTLVTFLEFDERVLMFDIQYSEPSVT